jgi:MFS family permease
MEQNAPASPEPHHDKGPARLALIVLGLCFVLAALGRGAGETFTVFLLPVSGTFGWDRAQAVSVYSISALCTGLAAPFVGKLFDRSGPRAVYGVGLLLLGAGFSAAAFARELWQLQACIGLAVGLGGTCLGTITGSLLLNRWFGPRLPAALAVVASAAGAGVLLLVPLSQILIDNYDGAAPTTSSAAPCWPAACRFSCCRGGGSPPGPATCCGSRNPTPPPSSGRCAPRCATTRSGRCSASSSSPPWACSRSRCRW